MKNSKPWFDFLSVACPEGNGVIRVERSESLERTLFLDLKSKRNQNEIHVRFAVGLADSEGLSRSIHSGEISPAVDSLDRRLREARSKHPELPLLVAASPETLWPRSHAWMLGEYLAERDLPLWVDIRHLPGERALEWMGRLQETGLACPRMAIEISLGQGLSAASPLVGSGACAIGFRRETGEWEIGQM